jgi:hypothetical protein
MNSPGFRLDLVRRSDVVLGDARQSRFPVEFRGEPVTVDL